MSLSLKIKALRPVTRPLTDWSVVNTDGVESIEFWNPAAGIRPTQAELDALSDVEALLMIETAENAKEPLLADIKAQAQAAIAENDVFIAITGTLTNAQRDAQLRALTRHDTREIKALARLAVRTWR